MLKFEVIENKDIWEKFLLSQERQPFFQSWDWGEVQKRLGNKVLRWGVYDPASSSGLVGICLVVEIKAKRGHFFHLRHGPVFSVWRKTYLDTLVEFLKKEAKKRGVDFVRISPLLPKGEKLRGFIDSPIHNMDAENAWVLDLDRAEEQLLSAMRKTTRYLIRKGEKQSLEIVREAPNINSFIALYKKTAQKHGFVPHQGIKEEFEAFKKDNLAQLFLVKFKKKIISGALVIFYGNQAVYHHGATDPKYEWLSPSYLLQWEAICEAKKRGKKIYNFWGISEKPNHPWAGLTLFKKGFGGRKEEFIHAQDLPLTFWYFITYTIESIQRAVKGY